MPDPCKPTDPPRAWWVKLCDPAVMLAAMMAAGSGAAWLESRVNAQVTLTDRVAGLEKRVDAQSLAFDKAQEQLGSQVANLSNQFNDLGRAFAAVGPRLDMMAEVLRDLRDNQRHLERRPGADR